MPPRRRDWRRSRSTWWSKRGMNEDSIVPMARHFKGSGHIVRFIEYMDVGATNGWRMDDVVPRARSCASSTREMPLAPADPNYRGEVAERWRYADGSGEIGVIASVTQAFCRDCTRARLSTEASSTPASSRARPRPARAAARRPTTRRSATPSARSGASAAIATGAPHGRPRPRAPKVEMSYIGG